MSARGGPAVHWPIQVGPLAQQQRLLLLMRALTLLLALLLPASALPRRRAKQSASVGGLRSTPAANGTWLTPSSYWPQPQSVQAGSGACYHLPASTKITVTGFTTDVTAAAATRFEQVFFAYGGAKTQAPPAALASLANITVSIATPDSRLRFGIDESYTLSVANGEAVITANTSFGAIWALETLSQTITRKFSANAKGALNASWYEICDIDIVDAPRFPYRALLIDTSRHYITVPAIKEVISMMSYLKLNGLHLHATDTQSWPLYIPSRPEISNASAYSPLHMFYPADLAELIAYGRAHGVVVYPEVDFPAHGAEILKASYPGITCDSCGLFDPLYPGLWDILRDIYTAMDEVFPPEYPFHMGGDEVDRGAWASCPNVTAWAAASNGRYVPDDITKWFELELFTLLSDETKGLNRTVIAWEDVGAGLIDGNWSNVPQKLILEQWDGSPGVWNWDTCVPLQQNGSVIIAGPFHIADTPANNYVDLFNVTCLTPRVEQQIYGPELCVAPSAP